MSRAAAVVWHEVECGAYAGDLALWRELAEGAAGPVLELGCGTGRVALDLARAGHQVSGLDRVPELVAELRRSAEAEELAVEAVVADARSFELGRSFELLIAPMQLFQLLGGAIGRRRVLERARSHLAPGSCLAVALLAEVDVDAPSEEPAVTGSAPLPDVLELSGWVYSSLPVEVRHTAQGIEVRRLRQAISPRGELAEELDLTVLDLLAPALLESEATATGFAPGGRIEVPPTADHLGSTVVILGAR